MTHVKSYISLLITTEGLLTTLQPWETKLSVICGLNVLDNHGKPS